MPSTKKPKPTKPAAKERVPKSDTATVALRVEEVLLIRLDGAQFHDVVQYAAEKRWGIHERQIREYISRADDLLVERLEADRRRLIALHVARRESLYARAVNGADYRTALAVLSDLDKLRGLYAPAPDAPPAAGTLSGLTDAQKAAILDVLRGG